MRRRLCLALLLLTGCVSTQLTQDENATAQVGSTPFAEPGKPAPTRVNYAPASLETSMRVVQIKDKLLGDNPQIGLKPYAIAIGSADPEVFHVGLTYIYVTEGLVRQCSDAQLAAVLANEMGKMISQRERSVADQIRQPAPLLPIQVPVGGSSVSLDTNPLGHVEMARYELAHPKTPKKLTPPNPQHVARSILERAGYQRTDLDAALPILDAAERNAVLANQFKAPAKQSGWKTP